MKDTGRFLEAVVCLWLACGSMALACQIPVFRYALERWEAEPYVVIVFHRGAMGAAEQRAVDLLKGAEKSIANIKMQLVDLAGSVDEPMRKMWEGQAGAALPWMMVRYPGGDEEVPGVWAGRLNVEAAEQVIDSPARREIVRRIAGGESAVWVLLESGDKGRDDSAAQVLSDELGKALKDMALPDMEAEPDGPRLLSELPLKLAFSVLRVSRANPGERFLVSMLVKSDREVGGVPPAIAYPVFGRGRVLGGLMMEGARGEQIAQGARFICGACSCQVKAMNPGFDMLLAADWQNILDGGKLREPAMGVPDSAAGLRGVEEVGAVPVSWTVVLGVGAALVLLFGYLAWRSRPKMG